ncbi:amidohydrolase family protein [Pseudonocardia sp. C8]|uniref:amidohydrolase family protein n=1 Tax=Pseudonocardia sp. C8 TaxID=2762759 RepID=UPI0016436052|nr:amidohydrolase family protein [Pseudonocardia sp. C8]MBC3193757.1 amidohydrolase family protein [Pseudonocardia sp. C8]
MELLANDIDSHEMIPGHLLGDVLGKPGRIMGRLFEVMDELRPDPTPTNMHQPDIVGDVSPIEPCDIWKIKGPPAPSAIDMHRRLEVLDTMGIDRQLVFPTTAIAAMMVGGMNDTAFDMRFGGDVSMLEGMSRPEFTASFLRAYNEWVTSEPVLADGRIRMVGIVPTSENLSEMIATGRKLIDSGVRAVYVQADNPPGGLSPAHSELDPFWRMFEEADVPVTLHIGTEFAFLDPRWSMAETFMDLFQSPEIPNTTIHMFATVHMAVDNYLSTMVLGGVFERFPRLRVGLLEVGAHWVGNAARRMDMYVGVFPGSAAARFPLKPSEYIARNVRVSPFNFEPIDRYFKDDPDLADVFCFSSDYPHVEGTKDALDNMAAKVEPLGEELATKFFTKNAEWLLP